MSIFKILVVNPGSTSTKMGYFENEKAVAVKKVEHSASELEKYPRIQDQYPLRKKVMLDFLHEINIKPTELSAVVGRGGLLRPMPSGTYRITQRMLDDLSAARFGEHASNIGAFLAYGFYWDYNIPAFIVDPPCVDEILDVARLSGLKEIPRHSLWHALNIMAVTRQVCKKYNWNFREENFVVAHLGGGISVAALEKGRCIDVSNGLDAGPYTPERAGTVPTLELVKICFSGKYTEQEVKKMLVGRGGLVSYLGTSDLVEVERRVEQGDDYAKLVLDGMCYQIAKEIGAFSTVLKGKIKRIIITGGMARSSYIVPKVIDSISWIAQVEVVPGEDELAALAQGALRVLRKEEEPLNYDSLP